MSPRARSHKDQLMLVTKFGAGNASRMAVTDDVPSSSDTALFLIGKNKDGFWVAREESGCAGGVFFTERGARQFAKRWAKPLGCATRRVSEPLELDFKGDGNVFIPIIAAFRSERNYRIPEPVRDVIGVVLGLATLAIAIWLTIALLTLGR